MDWFCYQIYIHELCIKEILTSQMYKIKVKQVSLN